MTALDQILLGSVLLSLCAVVHVLAVSFSIPVFRGLSKALPFDRLSPLRAVVFLLLAIVVVLAAHTVQIWSWAGVFVLLGSFAEIETSFYFSTVTYTTLGYGDIVLGDGVRILATFCAITGLLTFGISTAFLIGVLVRTVPNLVGEG